MKKRGPLKRELEWPTVAREIALLNKPYAPILGQQPSSTCDNPVIATICPTTPHILNFLLSRCHIRTPMAGHTFMLNDLTHDGYEGCFFRWIMALGVAGFDMGISTKTQCFHHPHHVVFLFLLSIFS